MDRKQTTILILVGVVIAIIVGLINKFGEGTDNSFGQLPSKTGSPSAELAINDGQQPGQSPQVNTSQAPRHAYPQFPGELPPADLKNKKVAITTAKGVIEMMIYPEATKAASNFLFLTREKFYDGLTFHRVEPGFVVQGGDPLGNGSGGPGYKFEDEPVTRKYDKGIVAMANAGPNTNGSQFFIMLEDNPNLPPSYTIFGKVTKGMEVVSKIAVGDVMQSVSVVEVSK